MRFTKRERGMDMSLLEKGGYNAQADNAPGRQNKKEGKHVGGR